MRRGHTPWPPPHPSAPPPPHGSTSCPSLHTLVSAQAGCTPPSLHSSERKIERGRCEHVLHICTPPSNQQGSWWKTFAFLNYTYTFSPQLIIFLKHKSMFLKSLRKLKVGWHKLYQSTWQSRVENERYSVAYFDRITRLETRYL